MNLFKSETIHLLPSRMFICSESDCKKSCSTVAPSYTHSYYIQRMIIIMVEQRAERQKT